jgi:hypothetical protein
MNLVSLSSCGVLVLAALGFQSQDKIHQAPQGVVRSTEKIVLQPTSFSWSDMVTYQKSLPDLSGVVQVPTYPIEIPTIEVPLPQGFTQRSKAAQAPGTGGVQHVIPCVGFPSEPAIGAGFDSQLDVPDGAGFSFIPPDVAGAVGPNHLMTMLENRVLIQDRLGNAVSNVDLNTFWTAIGTTPLSPTTVYPRVEYDAHLGRWVATIRNGSTGAGATVVGVAISQTDDPTGTWDFYAITADPGATTFADWVTLGYNVNWITIVANMFNVVGGAFAGTKGWIIDATNVPIGGPITVTVLATGFTGVAHPGAAGNSLMPARTVDGTTTEYMLNTAFTAGGVFLLQITQITGTGPAPVVSGLAGSPFGGTTSFCYTTTNWSGTQRTMAQVGEARFIAPFSIRQASTMVRGGKIWAVNSGGLPGPSTNGSPTSNGVIWRQIDPSLPFPASPGAPGSMLVQDGAITNGVNTMSMFPSIAVNCAEDVLIGYSNGDATRLPRACYSMRLGTSALNFMGAINELKAGESTYWKNFGVGTTAQYGRYTSAAVDPNDNITLWTLQEYADTRVGPGDNDSRWGTWWGRFGDCQIRPVITDQPDDVIACIDDPVSFQVAATTGTNTLTYQWRLDGVDILGANSDTYSIANAAPADQGDYDCVIQGCGEEISAVANLALVGAEVTTDPVDVVAAVGDPASFFVAGTGSGTLTYQWLADGNPISGETTDTYNIASVAVADYFIDVSCTITDDCGPATSETARVRPVTRGNNHELAELTFHIFKQPGDTTTCTGGPAVFEVVAYPEGVAYEWYKDGSPIVPAENGNTLTISGADAGDVGNYKCLVTFQARARFSDEVSLVVDDIPTIDVEPSPVNKTANPGATVTYTVEASGDGELHYQWQHKGTTPFAPFENIDGANDPSLILENVTSDDSGQYRCVVSNHCGFVRTRNVRLTVL